MHTTQTMLTFTPVNASRLTFLFNPHIYGKHGPHHTVVLPTVQWASEWAPHGNTLLNITIDAQYAPALAAGELVCAGAVECFEAAQQSARTRRAVVAGSATKPVWKTVLWGAPAIVEELLAPHEAGKQKPALVVHVGGAHPFQLEVYFAGKMGLFDVEQSRSEEWRKTGFVLRCPGSWWVKLVGGVPAALNEALAPISLAAYM